MKGEHRNRPGKKLIRTIAAEWVIKSDHGLSAEQQDELNEWLSENPLHRDLYFRERRSWDDLDRLVGMHETYRKPVNPDLLDGDLFVKPKRVFPRNYWTGMVSIAAVVAVMFLIPFISMNPSPKENVSTIEKGEYVERIKRIHLADGSVVSLNRGAEVREEFSKEERLVRLFNGEANFKVEKDSDRPFIVDVFGVRVKAVGTAFNVRISEEQVDVIVTEGVISMHSNSTVAQEDQIGESLVEANSRATVSMRDATRKLKIEELDNVTIDQELLWQPVLIDFEDAPLEDIIEEFNRRNPIHIVVKDPALSSLQLSSMFWSDNVNGFIRLLDGKFGIKAQAGERNTVYLYQS